MQVPCSKTNRDIQHNFHPTYIAQRQLSLHSLISLCKSAYTSHALDHNRYTNGGPLSGLQLSIRPSLFIAFAMTWRISLVWWNFDHPHISRATKGVWTCLFLWAARRTWSVDDTYQVSWQSHHIWLRCEYSRALLRLCNLKIAILSLRKSQGKVKSYTSFKRLSSWWM